jgi:hypothetical protein
LCALAADHPLLIVGGVALPIAGAGPFMAHPDIRRQVRDGLSSVLPEVPGNLTGGLAAVVPDFERYMKIGAM